MRFCPGTIFLRTLSFPSDQFGVARRGVQEPLTLQITSVLRYECDSGWLSATGLDLAEGEGVLPLIFVDPFPPATLSFRSELSCPELFLPISSPFLFLQCR